MKTGLHIRQELDNKLVQLLRDDGSVYIYGAGIVGKRLFKVIEQRNLDGFVEGFVVSTGDRSQTVCGKRVFLIEEIEDCDAKILVAVGDAYQNEILYFLEKNGYKNVVNAYIYSFIDEEYLSEELMQDVPTEAVVDIRELMLMQFQNGQFQRYDILIRFEEIRREKRKKHTAYIPAVSVHANLEICGGREEMALALYHGVEEVHIEQNYESDFMKCDRRWMNKRLSAYEIEEIEALLEALKKEWYETFIAIIWPPAYPICNAIIEEMGKYVRIENQTDLEVNTKEALEAFTLEIYQTDEVVARQIDRKIKRMQREKRFCFKIVEFYLDAPGFYVKRYGHTISRRGMDMKLEIRNKYKNQVEDYLFDVILHTADNYSQSRKLREIIEGYRK